MPWSVHLLCYVVLGSVFLSVILARHTGGMVVGDTIGNDPVRVRQVEQRIDPNTASWAELARLPGIGEILAKRIVAYREGRGSALGPARESVVAFSSLADLGLVRGIGPKKLEQLAGYLKLPAAEAGQQFRE